MEVTLMLIIFFNLSTTKMKFSQVLVCCMAIILNMFLAQCRRLETSSRPLYCFIEMTIYPDFIKMTIYPDLAIFNS